MLDACHNIVGSYHLKNGPWMTSEQGELFSFDDKKDERTVLLKFGFRPYNDGYYYNGFIYLASRSDYMMYQINATTFEIK